MNSILAHLPDCQNGEHSSQVTITYNEISGFQLVRKSKVTCQKNIELSELSKQTRKEKVKSDTTNTKNLKNCQSGRNICEKELIDSEKNEHNVSSSPKTKLPLKPFLAVKTTNLSNNSKRLNANVANVIEL